MLIYVQNIKIVIHDPITFEILIFRKYRGRSKKYVCFRLTDRVRFFFDHPAEVFFRMCFFFLASFFENCCYEKMNNDISPGLISTRTSARTFFDLTLLVSIRCATSFFCDSISIFHVPSFWCFQLFFLRHLLLHFYIDVTRQQNPVQSQQNNNRTTISKSLSPSLWGARCSSRTYSYLGAWCTTHIAKILWPALNGKTI